MLLNVLTALPCRAVLCSGSEQPQRGVRSHRGRRVAVRRVPPHHRFHVQAPWRGARGRGGREARGRGQAEVGDGTSKRVHVVFVCSCERGGILQQGLGVPEWTAQRCLQCDNLGSESVTCGECVVAWTESKGSWPPGVGTTGRSFSWYALGAVAVPCMAKQGPCVYACTPLHLCSHTYPFRHFACSCTCPCLPAPRGAE